MQGGGGTGGGTWISSPFSYRRALLGWRGHSCHIAYRFTPLHSRLQPPFHQNVPIENARPSSGRTCRTAYWEGRRGGGVNSCWFIENIQQWKHSLQFFKKRGRRRRRRRRPHAACSMHSRRQFQLRPSERRAISMCRRYVLQLLLLAFFFMPLLYCSSGIDWEQLFCWCVDNFVNLFNCYQLIR